MYRFYLFTVFFFSSIIILGQNFPTHQIDSNANATFTDLQLVDVDSDQDLDVIVAPNYFNSVWWYENQGGGVFGSFQVLASGIANINQVEFVDMDLDGDRDLIIGSSNDWEDIFWVENLGGLNFDVPDTIPTSISGIDEIHIADFNNDTLPDILVAGWYSNTISVYTNLGGGSFGNEVIIDTNLFNDWDLQLFDFNQDGFQDIFFSTDGTDSVRIYEGLGNGLFSPPIILDLNTGSCERTKFVFLDLDGDSDYEIISNEALNNCLGFYRNFGNYQFSGPTTMFCGAGDNTLIGVELNGDTLIDIVAYDTQIGKLIWYKNLGGLSFDGDYKITPNITNGSQLVSGDIDNDGDNDIISYNDYISWQQSDPLILWHENRLNEIALETEYYNFDLISVFPNPTNGRVTIYTTEHFDKIEVFNLNGELMQRVNSNEREVNISGLTDGFYLLKMTTISGEVYTKRIVKQ